MSSRREQILAHIATTLAGTVQVDNRIYRSRECGIKWVGGGALTPRPLTNSLRMS